MKNKKATFIALVAFVLVVGLMTGIYFVTRPQPEEGEKSVTIIVIHKDDTQKTFTYQTEEEYLGGLLVSVGLIPEGNIQNGMFDTVDGETAVWSEDEGWWAIYVGDEMSNYGVNELPLTDGGIYRLEYTNGYAS